MLPQLYDWFLLVFMWAAAVQDAWRSPKVRPWAAGWAIFSVSAIVFARAGLPAPGRLLWWAAVANMWMLMALQFLLPLRIPQGTVSADNLARARRKRIRYASGQFVVFALAAAFVVGDPLFAPHFNLDFGAFFAGAAAIALTALIAILVGIAPLGEAAGPHAAGAGDMGGDAHVEST